MAASDDEYEIPLRDQRIFGAGIKRKRIHFVPSKSEPATPHTTSTSSAADKYLAIVLGETLPKSSKDDSKLPPPSDSGTVCDICRGRIAADDLTTPHESSIAHQICLQHSHPPSNVDRTRKGLTVLQSQGWDPDAWKGLGAQGEGLLHPIKAKENPARAGLGAEFVKVKTVEKPVKLDAGKVRAMEKTGKKKAEDLRNAFYRSEEVEKYLGQDQRNGTLDLGAFKRAKRKG